MPEVPVMEATAEVAGFAHSESTTRQQQPSTKLVRWRCGSSMQSENYLTHTFIPVSVTIGTGESDRWSAPA